MDKAHEAIVDAITKEWTDRGMIIEAGWKTFELMVVEAHAGTIQRDEMRKAFFAGAQHLFSSIMAVLDPGEEPTPQDMLRMGLIDDELRRFSEEIIRSLVTEGGRQ